MHKRQAVNSRTQQRFTRRFLRNELYVIDKNFLLASSQRDGQARYRTVRRLFGIADNVHNARALRVEKSEQAIALSAPSPERIVSENLPTRQVVQHVNATLQAVANA